MAVVTQDDVYPTEILKAYDSKALSLLQPFKRNDTVEVKLFASIQP